MKTLIAFVALTFALAPTAWAATRSVTLFVPGMTCAACPITVRTALDRVPGVDKIRVSGDRLITVDYDDRKTNPRALTRATKDAGYPSRVKH